MKHSTVLIAPQSIDCTFNRFFNFVTDPAFVADLCKACGYMCYGLEIAKLNAYDFDNKVL